MTQQPPLAIGIDFGGTSIKPAVVRGSEVVERGQALDTQALGAPAPICDAMVAEISRLRAAHPQVAAIGAGMPGMVDAGRGLVRELSNVAGWKDIPLRSIFEERCGLPAAVDNDARAMAFAEWRFGAANSAPNVICVTLGTGVGGGLILDGRLYRGAFNGAGEIGQTSIDIHGVPAVYGNLGAVERYVGNRQIAERAQAAYREAGVEKPLEACSPRALSEAADAGDAIAAQMWETVGTELGAMLANLVWLLNPDCIVIGGGVAKAGDRLFQPIRTAIQSRTMEVYWRDLQIVPAALGSDAGVIGAAALGLESTRR